MKKIYQIILCLIFITSTYAPAISASNEDIREQAKILYLGDKMEEAQRRILEIPQNERNAADYFLIGNTLEDKKLAIQAYEKAIGLDKTFYQAYYNLGQIYLGVDNYEKAIEYFKSSVKYNKDFAYGYYNLGCTYLKTEQYSKAKNAFENAIRLNPKEPDFYYNLAYAYKKTENLKRADKAINLYNELMKKRSAD